MVALNGGRAMAPWVMERITVAGNGGHVMPYPFKLDPHPPLAMVTRLTRLARIRINIIRSRPSTVAGC